MPTIIKEKSFDTVGFKLYLIVKGMPDGVAAQLTELMRDELHQFMKCWNIPDMDFFAMGGETAKRLGLIE